MAMLEITLQVSPVNRPAAAGVYTKYRQPFLARLSDDHGLARPDRGWA